jgi:type I restriction enzyme, R subunit
VAPLLRFVADVDIAAETFTHKLERLNLQILKGKPSADLMQSIAEDVSLLPQHVLDDAGKKDSVNLALSNDLATATPAQVRRVVAALAPAMFQKRRTVSAFLKIDLPDFLAHRGFIEVGVHRDQVYVQEYRDRVDKRVLEIASSHPAFVAIRDGRAPSDDELVDLERVLKLQVSPRAVILNSCAA